MLSRFVNGQDLQGRERTPGSRIYSLRERRALVLRCLVWAAVLGWAFA